MVLQVQEMLRQQGDKEQASTVTMAKAANRLAREHEKSRKAEDRQETSSEIWKLEICPSRTVGGIN